MAAQAKLISIRHPQIVSRGPSVRVVAIGTTHLPFPQRMVVRQAHLGPLAFVTSKASIICLPPWLHDHLGFGNQILHRSHAAWSHHIKTRFRFGAGFRVGVSLMALSAANLIGSVRPRNPVAEFCILSMTTQTHAVSVVGGTMAKGNDL
jgi:hypothetical protein